MAIIYRVPLEHVPDSTPFDYCLIVIQKQGLRVTRQRQAVQDVLASEDPEMDGLGAEPGVTVLRASAAGAHACCLLSNHRLHLMVLEEGDETDADLLPVGLGGEEEEGAGDGVEGAWEGVEAMCMFGVQVGLQERRVSCVGAVAVTKERLYSRLKLRGRVKVVWFITKNTYQPTVHPLVRIPEDQRWFFFVFISFFFWSFLLLKFFVTYFIFPLCLRS